MSLHYITLQQQQKQQRHNDTFGALDRITERQSQGQESVLAHANSYFDGPSK